MARVTSKGVTVELRSCRGPDLDAATLYALLRLRVEVFVVEQACPYRELDGRDLTSRTRHFWLTGPGEEILSTLRLTEDDDTRRPGFRISRVCTAVDGRHRGHGGRLLRAALDDVGEQPCRLNAQTYLAGMYARHGFAVDGEEFLDDGIPHVPMLRARP